MQKKNNHSKNLETENSETPKGMRVTFWGTRGSFPCSGDNYRIYGGNTSCVSCEIEDLLIIFDAGSGMKSLGTYIDDKKYTRASLFLTHVHFDHIMGLPFFQKNWDPEFYLDLYAGTLGPYGGLEKTLEAMVCPPQLPFTLKDFKATWTFHDFKAGQALCLSPQVHLTTFSLNHPNGAMGYKLDSQGKTLCYITDTEYTDQTVPKDFLDFIRYADLVIFDAAYTQKEYDSSYKGRGHSPWESVVRICMDAQVRQTLLFHHAPHHTDESLGKRAQDLRGLCPSALVSYDGLCIEV